MRVYQLSGTTGIDDLRLSEVPEPVVSARQVLIRMHAASLNFRDLLIITGRYSRNGIRSKLVPLSDGAGEVVQVGSDVSRFKAGDRVAGIFHQRWIAGEISDAVMGSALGGDIDGVLAEYRTFDEGGLVHLPSHLSYEEGATLPCAAVTAWNALFGLRSVQPGDSVLTLGSGGVSVFAIQYAVAAGARVIATSSSDAKLERLQALGATGLVNYKRTPEWGQEVHRLTDGRGVDQVVEVGGAGTLPQSLRAVRRGGLVTVIGVLSGVGQVDPVQVLMKSILLQGLFVGSREMFEAMNRAIVTQQMRPVIDRVFPFEQAADAYRYLESGSHLGKVVIRIGR